MHSTYQILPTLTRILHIPHSLIPDVASDRLVWNLTTEIWGPPHVQTATAVLLYCSIEPTNAPAEISSRDAATGNLMGIEPEIAPFCQRNRYPMAMRKRQCPST
ncbi:hypothetical protein TWF788_007286 [Orbilia oligospora]|uniref:Uncharacterized protein n=1 Tax=Orbilia oligospora TaxID=2813651 RepID=A0A7C8Q317_ORBOL|nr:hypothetical protein TWF788_007286 [Orbilia oligospora]